MTGWLPRCRTCGPLGPADNTLDHAVTTCNMHHARFPHHKTSWTPTYANPADTRKDNQ